jgi:hypothetical protein
MISQLASPSVCVVDDEEADYEPILKALNEIFVSCIHILGNDLAKLPPRPFKRLQLVFLDLHLTNTTGRNAASHTANVFTRIVSPETAPIVVVIWSKYAGDIPQSEDETEAALFKRTLLDAEPRYSGRLIFVEMAKPKANALPQDWTDRLKTEIDTALGRQEAIELLWTWDSLVRDATVSVSEGLTSIAAASKSAAATELNDALKEAMQRLAETQGEGDFSAATAPAHLVTALTALLTDQLEHMNLGPLAAHGAWLAAARAKVLGSGFASRMNGLLLTAAPAQNSGPFLPGTVYRVKDPTRFGPAFGNELPALVTLCCEDKPDSERGKAWAAAARPVLVEVSPACDVAQKHRVSALLIGGLIVPASFAGRRKRSGAFDGSLATLYLRWNASDFPEQDAALIFCYRYKTVIPANAVPDWVEPWFRLRELPTASLRAFYSGQSARVGIVQVGA